MKVRFFSDLHVEFGDCTVQGDHADVIVLAGDIGVGMQGVDWILKQKFECPVIYVLGNHEYYRHAYPEILDEIRSHAAQHDIFVLENESVTMNNIVFHGATLWTDFALLGDARLAGFTCQRVVNDFEFIRYGPSGANLRAADVARLHRRTLKWLAGSLHASPNAVNVVVTHHAPSVCSVSERYRGNIVTSSFASDLDAFILANRPDHWLHGHLHASCDYCIGDCRVQCNPKGYPNVMNPAFDPTLTLDI